MERFPTVPLAFRCCLALTFQGSCMKFSKDLAASDIHQEKIPSLDLAKTRLDSLCNEKPNAIGIDMHYMHVLLFKQALN